MMKRLVACGSVMCLTFLALAVSELSASVPYASEVLPLRELKSGVKGSEVISRAAEERIASTIAGAEGHLEREPSSLAHREMLTLYTGTAAGMPRLIYDEEKPLCWSVPVAREGAIVGFLLYHPYTGSVMSAPMWGGSGEPVMSVDEGEWNELEAIVARRTGVPVGNDARLVQIVQGGSAVLYLAVPYEGGVWRVDVTSLGEPGGLAPLLLAEQPESETAPSHVTQEPGVRPTELREGGGLDLPIPDVFSVAVMPRIIDQAIYGACTGHAAASVREWWECGAICYDGTGNSNDFTCECDKNYFGSCVCIAYNLSREYMYDRSRTWPEGVVYDEDCALPGFCIGRSCNQGTCSHLLVTDGDMMQDNPYCGQCGGASPANAADVLVNDGTCTEQCQPYPNYGFAGPQHAGCTNGGREACTGQCPNVSGACGDDFRLQSCAELWTAPQIPDAVYHHGPVLGGGAICNPCWMYPGAGGCLCAPVCPCAIAGGHAYMIYGYDNDYTPPVLFLQNSWGTGWGQLGRGMSSQDAYAQFQTPPDFYFVGGKNIRITVTPQGTVVPRGGTLNLTIEVENFTAQTQSFQAWTDVYLPNGNPFPGNPIVGPVSVTLQPYQTKSKALGHFVPQAAPLGFYRYVGCVGLYPLQIDDDDEFIFIVTP